MRDPVIVEIQAMKQKVLLLGAKGMLGQALAEEFQGAGYEVAAWDREEVDVTDFAMLEEKVRALRPEIIFNATGYNSVDACEQDDEEYRKAVLLNGEVPQRLAKLTKELKAVLVSYSTDYVFDGERESLAHPDGYTEDAKPQPLSRYAETKLMGERAVLEGGEKYYLIRLCRLFGRPGTSAASKKSFFAAMLELGRKETEVKLVDGEKSCFTYAPDTARATRELIESGDPYGIYHLPNTEAATWYEAGCELFRQAGMETKIVPITTDELSRAAKRPEFSYLLNMKRPQLRSYQEALGDFLKNFQ